MQVHSAVGGMPKASGIRRKRKGALLSNLETIFGEAKEKQGDAKNRALMSKT